MLARDLEPQWLSELTITSFFWTRHRSMISRDKLRDSTLLLDWSNIDPVELMFANLTASGWHKSGATATSSPVDIFKKTHNTLKCSVFLPTGEDIGIFLSIDFSIYLY